MSHSELEGGVNVAMVWETAAMASSENARRGRYFAVLWWSNPGSQSVEITAGKIPIQDAKR